MVGIPEGCYRNPNLQDVIRGEGGVKLTAAMAGTQIYILHGVQGPNTLARKVDTREALASWAVIPQLRLSPFSRAREPHLAESSWEVPGSTGWGVHYSCLRRREEKLTPARMVQILETNHR